MHFCLQLNDLLNELEFNTCFRLSCLDLSLPVSNCQTFTTWKETLPWQQSSKITGINICDTFPKNKCIKHMTDEKHIVFISLQPNKFFKKTRLQFSFESFLIRKVLNRILVWNQQIISEFLPTMNEKPQYYGKFTLIKIVNLIWESEHGNAKQLLIHYINILLMARILSRETIYTRYFSVWRNVWDWALFFFSRKPQVYSVGIKCLFLNKSQCNRYIPVALKKRNSRYSRFFRTLLWSTVIFFHHAG